MSKQDPLISKALPISALSSFLKNAWPGFEEITEIQRFLSGYSNLTFSLTTNLGKVVLRRPPLGPRAKSAHDMVREFRLLNGLEQVFAKAPQAILVCEDETVVGAPFYLMELVEGDIIRIDAKGNTQALEINQRTQASKALIETLAELHNFSLNGTYFEQLGRPEGYIGRQVEGWTARFENAKTGNVPGISHITDFLIREMPGDSPGSIIHNDYKFDNVVFSPQDFTQVRAVLDWEMCTVGNPLMDLGLSLAYWAHAEEVKEMPFLGINATHLPGCLRRSELASYYESASGREIGDLLYYFIFGNFKLAGIIQQIYKRFADGHANDQRFAQLHHVVSYLISRTERSMASGKIE